jgi:hypothetical protein
MPRIAGCRIGVGATRDVVRQGMTAWARHSGRVDVEVEAGSAAKAAAAGVRHSGGGLDRGWVSEGNGSQDFFRNTRSREVSWGRTQGVCLGHRSAGPRKRSDRLSGMDAREGVLPITKRNRNISGRDYIHA